ncbi:MAG: prephenate dehydrogenase/arogenate dehydrogenase family protein [Streptosporangiales bacterium]|nr:prephenate dehydrogenase/arogenate dehydrogenase family protein [Streptosporangiales bacterium]
MGAGLIGTSIALALRARDADVLLTDRDPANLRLATDLGAGRSLEGAEPGLAPAGEPRPWSGDAPGPASAGGRAEPGAEPVADLVVIAVPPAAVAATLRDAQARRLGRVYTDAASVKSAPLAAARTLGCDLGSYVPGHPMGGSERSGPAAARADLFLGRPWALCPAPETAESAVEAVTELARACGAEPVRLSPADHDRAVALVSHGPHVTSAAVAARLAAGDPAALRLSGQGVRDVTRIAAGDPRLWTGILRHNAGPVADVLDAVAHDLTEAAAALRKLGAGDDASADTMTGLLRRGNTGRDRIPGKHGGPSRAYAVVPVVIPDEPGALARLFAAAETAGVNIEDVRLDHSPGLPVGVAQLSVRPQEAERLSAALAEKGWSVHG